MTKTIKRYWLSALLICVFATAASAQGNIADLQTQAEDALVNDRPAEAAALSQSILDLQPENYAALLVLGLAQTDLGDTAQAAKTGALAYEAARDEQSRLQAARLVASARFQQQQYIRAEFWLRRAVNHAQTDEEVRAVAREYLATIRANPLTLQFTASVAPSDNINDGSEDGILSFETIGLTLQLPEDRLALSGIAYAGSARATYRLSENDRQRTFLTGFVSGETYTLSSEAKDILASSPNADVRDVDGDDFATVLAEVGITRQQANLSPIGPVNLSLNFGSYWEGGTRLVNYRDVIVNQIVPLDDVSAVSIRASRRDQEALEPSLIDSQTYDVIWSYNRSLENRDQLQLNLAWRKSDAGSENSYLEYRAGIGYGLGQPVFGTRLSTTIELGYRTYDEFVTTLDGREDRFITAETSAIFEEITYFGFSPSVSVSARRTESSAEENTSAAVQVLFGIESNF